MRTRWLLWTSDGLLGESLQRQRSIAGGHLSPSWHGATEKPGVVCVTRSPTTCAFGEPEASYCSFRAAQITCFHRAMESCPGHTVSRRLGASSGINIAAAEAFQGECEGDEYDKELTWYRGLVLDVSYRPINVVCWRRALCLEILEKADVLEYYDQVISSPSRPFAIPAVLRITDYVHTPKQDKLRLSLNRRNIFLRDKFRCQYCNAHENLTVDHVVPVSQGGEWTWQNLVTACSNCNARKSDKSLEESNMKLIKMPKEPSALDGRDMPSSYAALRTLQHSERMPSEWIHYLPKRFQPSDTF